MFLYPLSSQESQNTKKNWMQPWRFVLLLKWKKCSQVSAVVLWENTATGIGEVFGYKLFFVCLFFFVRVLSLICTSYAPYRHLSRYLLHCLLETFVPMQSFYAGSLWVNPKCFFGLILKFTAHDCFPFQVPQTTLYWWFITLLFNLVLVFTGTGVYLKCI